MRPAVWCLAFLALAAAPAQADLTAAKAEANLEKRSKLAIDNADAALSAAIKSYNDGESKRTEAALAEVRESVDLAYKALRDSGKKPTRSPKYFKQAELRTRALAKRLSSFREDMNVADRGLVEEVLARVNVVHDEILDGIMGGWK